MMILYKKKCRNKRNIIRRDGESFERKSTKPHPLIKTTNSIITFYQQPESLYTTHSNENHCPKNSLAWTMHYIITY
jgi:hypothetical protein